MDVKHHVYLFTYLVVKEMRWSKRVKSLLSSVDLMGLGGEWTGPGYGTEGEGAELKLTMLINAVENT